MLTCLDCGETERVGEICWRCGGRELAFLEVEIDLVDGVIGAGVGIRLVDDQDDERGDGQREDDDAAP